MVCDADPATELDADLYYCDSCVAWTNPVLIDVLDTTAGVFSEDTDANINGGAAVANGKKIYLQFGAQPISAIKQISGIILWHAEED